MKLDVLRQKIDDLEYKMKIAHEGINTAEYNIKFAKRLGLNERQLNNYIDASRYYATKIYNNQKEHDALLNCYNDIITSNTCNHNYFKCTLPYEVVDSSSSYQTTVVVNENAVKLFANGIDYNTAIDCLDNGDIVGIQSKYKMTPICDGIEKDKVAVEAIGDKYIKKCVDIPIVSKFGDNKSYSGLIASSKVPTCFSINTSSFKDLDGNTFAPDVPTFEGIDVLRKQAEYKKNQYMIYKEFENKVSKKMSDAFIKINDAYNSKKNNV